MYILSFVVRPLARRSLATLLTAAAGLALASCAAGTAARGTIRPAFANGSTVVVDPRTVPRPNRNSLEYRLSWGLQAIHADRAYALGASGAGVTVALIDTGLSSEAAQVLAHVSPYSVDLLDRSGANPIGSHGEKTAGLVAAALDGKGTVGVAYQATVLAVRADIDGSCAIQCAVRAKDLARGIDYALAHGAKVIAVPLIGNSPLPAVEGALARAAASGAVIVMAAGNESRDAPAWPAHYASDPRFRGSIVVAGASTYGGQLSRWSNRAGAQENYYVAAPGENLLVDCDPKFCHLASGTSFSVSFVAGALALLLDHDRSLTPREAAVLLLAGAHHLSVVGTNPVTGHGLLDVAGALRLANEPVVALH